jgi:hypothetical protein
LRCGFTQSTPLSFFKCFQNSNNRTVKGDTKLLFPESKETKIYGRQNLVDKKLQLSTLLFLQKKKKKGRKPFSITNTPAQATAIHKTLALSP